MQQHTVRYCSAHPFSRWLLARIQSLGLPLATIAVCSGVSKTRLSELISDENPNPRISTVLRLAATLDVKPETVLSKFIKESV